MEALLQGSQNGCDVQSGITCTDLKWGNIFSLNINLHSPTDFNEIKLAHPT